MSLRIRAITLDLDDTLWPIMPAIDRAEAALDAWLAANTPRVAADWPLPRRQALRSQVDAERPDMAHDMTAQRQWMLERMFAAAGEDPSHVHAAFEAYFAARCEVDHYPDTLDALERLAAKLPLASVSNGNACLSRIGLMPLFRFQLGAREHGAAKPASSIYLDACDRLGVAPAQVLHVGDDIELDVVGAARAGLRTCWIDRRGERWPRHDVRPDLHFPDLAALADWVDAHLAMDSDAA
jgi:putative hydrolase of the HAD superfamily